MKIKVTTAAPGGAAEYFSSPLDFGQRVEMTKLLVMEQILACIEAAGISQTRLAEILKVSPARVSKMLDGKSNFTIETLLKTSDAIGADLKISMTPRSNYAREFSCVGGQNQTVFRPKRNDPPEIVSPFSIGRKPENDSCYAT